MVKVLSAEQVRSALANVDLVTAMERAFVAYSCGRAIVPPVGELLFEEPPGEAHLKYGYVRGDSAFVVKIATGFYDNSRIGLPANSGLILLFDAKTGKPLTILLDEGQLTDARTAAAGAVAAKYLAPSNVRRIGLCGTGIQARLQIRYLKGVVSCRDVVLWGRTDAAAARLAEELRGDGYSVEIANGPEDIAAQCNLIVTTTASKVPLLTVAATCGTHITAVGSDTAEKVELSAEVMQAADLVVVDSMAQAQHRGELYRALRAGVRIKRTVELGDVVAGTEQGRSSDESVTVCDLTGVAVQDIEASKAVLTWLNERAMS